MNRKQMSLPERAWNHALGVLRVPFLFALGLWQFING